MTSAVAALTLGCLGPMSVNAQTPHRPSSGETVLVESAAASPVVEKVRAGVPGVMVDVCVKVGDMVQKGQILGHTDCDAIKLQLDLARHTMEATGNLEAARGQAEAWTVTRKETEEAVRRRTATKSRLEWAIAMEKMYRSTYEVQVEAEQAQAIQYEYYNAQYEKHFFRAPVDGVVTAVLVDVGKPVTFATHAFTISNEDTYSVPVSVPASMAAAAVAQTTVPVRAADGKSACHAMVESVMNDPRTAGGKIIKLLVRSTDFPKLSPGDLLGMKFDVLLPQVAGTPHP